MVQPELSDGRTVSRRDEPRHDHDRARAARLFEVRGFQLLDQRAVASSGGLLIKYSKTNRALPAQNNDDQNARARDVGSVFYAWVTPEGAAGSRVDLLGKPTLAGAEPCTQDGLKLPCTRVTVSEQFVAMFMSGREEAQIVHGILSELQLEGFLVAPVAEAQLPDPRTP